MSYEDTKCPCGDKKETCTMLCPTCMEAFKGRREMRTFLDGNEPVEYRRHAATILLSLSRSRKRNLSNGQAQRREVRASD
jgi:hypothetical protein